MGTRGAIGLFKGGKGKITYNHFDSYPEGTGKDILKEIRGFSVEQIKKAFDNIRLVCDSEAKPTKEEIKEYQEYSNTQVGGSKEITYYQLVRELQGTLKPYIEGKVKIMIDNENFLKDSLFCEYAYIVNLDKEVFEVWVGFQKEPQENRYKIVKGDSDYFNCKLIKEYPLNKLPTEKQFLKDLVED